jgi:hypothetical protein
MVTNTIQSVGIRTHPIPSACNEDPDEYVESIYKSAIRAPKKGILHHPLIPMILP